MNKKLSIDLSITELDYEIKASIGIPMHKNLSIDQFEWAIMRSKLASLHSNA